jgi:hypothetical protein
MCKPAAIRVFGMKLPRLIVLAFGLTACGTEAGGSAVSTGDGGSTPRLDSSTSFGAKTGPCDAGTPEVCSCAGDGGVKSGTQQCYLGNWLSCNCYQSNQNTTPLPVVLTGDCRPGRYEGGFSGIYTSPYTGIGFPIPVVALNPAGPGLAFTLNGQRSGSGEFTELTISDGFVKGAADGLFPFDGVLAGTLDCTTKTFTGTLTGRYCVGPCLGANEGQFVGPVTGNYDGTNFTFTNGTWDLLEAMGNKPLFADNYGGNGEWSATWVGEGTVDLDSGVTTAGPAADAGP